MVYPSKKPQEGLPGMPYDVRPGVRGGTDQFSWQDVKATRERSYYLGSTVRAPYGRWQKDRDVYWYNRAANDNDPVDAVELEKRALRKREKIMRENAIKGVSNRHFLVEAQALEKFEIERAFAPGEEKEGRDPTMGLGFKPDPLADGPVLPEGAVAFSVFILSNPIFLFAI
ncbi:hypothetical protein MHBO_003988 [Bonamia ostreae]|uniref:Multiple myeloma tumor-associated protein 2-like N-terminal domain-containing protein n=1 Tax=Bonamia ostreae TaxID=126728 RepID=A0ABV2AS27_9EUKA